MSCETTVERCPRLNMPSLLDCTDSEIIIQWGIQNGPGTGKLISEFVFDGQALSANIGSLDPRKVL